ncbi:nucleotide exchange factor SIL1-like isoform X2 [Xenia sp. Carnegie-2017]|nr:nucleotide exchange factor SIL1-like isoform X2 [Xenia sp. Carnegie-2017]
MDDTPNVESNGNNVLTSKKRFIKIDRNLISKQKLKDALKDFKDKFHHENEMEDDVIVEHGKKKYRSMDEIKQEFQGTNIWMKKDIEIMKDQVYVLNNSASSKMDILQALEELEYLVHQIDNARDLDKIGGLTIVVNLLNATDNDDDVRSEAISVVGSAAQSNLPVQISLLQSGALHLLTRLLVDSRSSPTLKKKAVYALSAMLRLFPKGARLFLKLGGLSHLSSLFESNSNEKLQMKALTLAIDLLREQMDGIREKAKEMGIKEYEKAVIKAPLLKALYDDGWCELSSMLITSIDDTEGKEKLLQAFHVLLPACREEYKRLSRFKEALELWRQEWRREMTMDEEDDTGYLESLVRLVNRIFEECGWT